MLGFVSYWNFKKRSQFHVWGLDKTYWEILQEAVPFFFRNEMNVFISEMYEKHGQELEWRESQESGDDYCNHLILDRHGRKIVTTCIMDSDDRGFEGDWEIHPRSILFLRKGLVGLEEGISERDVPDFITFQKLMDDIVALAMVLSRTYENDEVKPY